MTQESVLAAVVANSNRTDDSDSRRVAPQIKPRPASRRIGLAFLVVLVLSGSCFAEKSSQNPQVPSGQDLDIPTQVVSPVANAPQASSGSTPDTQSFNKKVGEAVAVPESSLKKSSSGNNGGGHSAPKEVITVFAILCILLIAALCREIKKMTGAPFTPLLLVSGMIVGGYIPFLWEFGQGLEIIIDLDPHGILLIFIPILVFEAAYNTDLYFFKKEFYQVILLAGPGVAIGAIMLAVVFSYFLGYADEISFFGSLTFSSIICATDTVAVLALLKELGAPKYFSMMFEGENLLNDATAMVFYMIFSNLYKAQGMTAFGAILQFLRLSVGGFLLGGAVFLVTLVWLRRITKDKVLVIVITITSCYMTFFLAESVVGVSGLLAVVVLGVFMAMHIKMRLNPEAAEMVHTVISFIQFCLESTLFLITGVFIGKMYIFDNENTLVPSDYTKVVIFFVFMNVARYIMINILLPLINKSGYPLGWRDCIILAWGGVRGALGLALALIIYRDNDYSHRFKDLVLFYVAAMIVMTVIVNGLSIGMIMKLINFGQINPLTFKIKNNVLRNLVIISFQKRETLTNNRFLKLANMEEAMNMTGVKKLIVLQKKEEEKMRKKQAKLDANDKVKQMRMLTGPLKEPEYEETELEEIRLRYYNMVKSVLFEKYEEDFCSLGTLKALHEGIEVCKESLNKPLGIWENVNEELMSPEEVIHLLSLRKFPIIGRFTSGYFSKFFLNTYEKLNMVVMALNQIHEEKPEIPLHPEAVEKVSQELYRNKAKFESRLFYLCDLFPEFITNVQTKQAAQIILNSQRTSVHDSFQNGFIDEEDYDKLTGLIEKEISSLDVKDYNWSGKDINELELIEPMFSKLNKDVLKVIKESYIKVDYNTGQTIFAKGELVRGVYIITKGMAEEYITLDNRITHGVGAVVSFANVVSLDSVAMTNLNCIRDCQAYWLPRELVLNIAEQDAQFKKYIYKQALPYYLKIYGTTGFNLPINDSMANLIAETSDMVIKYKGEILSVDGGGFLFKGTLKKVDTGADNEKFNVPETIHEEEEDGNVHEHHDSEHSHSKDLQEKKDSGSPNSPNRNQGKAGLFKGLGLASGGEVKQIVNAPLLMNPLMNGYYKVEEQILYFSFKAANLNEDMGSMRFSVKPNSQSMNTVTKRASLHKKMNSNKGLDNEYAKIIEENFHDLAPKH
jgi:NhaP-type Na+/H+ or K+/H+ antiporter